MTLKLLLTACLPSTQWKYLSNRNGKTYLLSCLYSHALVNLVILALGRNDLKTYFNRNPFEITKGVGDLVNVIQTSLYGPAMQKAPQVLIISQIIRLLTAEELIDDSGSRVLKGTINKAKAAGSLYEKLAKKKLIFFKCERNCLSP